MSWKKYPSWLKGGILGVVVGHISLGLYFIFYRIINLAPYFFGKGDLLNNLKEFAQFLSISGIIFLLSPLPIPITPIISNIISYLLNILFYFIIGALIGFVYKIILRILP